MKDKLPHQKIMFIFFIKKNKEMRKIIKNIYNDEIFRTVKVLI